MCGIAGLFDQTITSESIASKAAVMMQSLLHRGPDNGDIWIDDAQNLALVHRRLAIQDLTSNGHQPMHSTSDRFCVVFNGEIYNFHEISADLSAHGHVFCGHSDTEVLLASIEEWGIDGAIKRFTGMFAFALWDKREAVLHLCRDRLGEKPLYYGWIGKRFCFASELKAIESCTDRDLDIDIEGLSDFLRNGYISAPASIYRGIFKLPPGCLLSLPLNALSGSVSFLPVQNGAKFSPRTYWSIHESAMCGLSDPVSNENEAVDLLDQLLQKTLKRQLVADVSVGAFLSGGIDSSLVSAVAQHVSAKPVKTYTIGFTEKEYDESRYAEKIAAHLGTEHLTMHVGPGDALNVVPYLPHIYDEPFADSSQLPTYLVSKLAKQHVTVCLSGDGGDELFAGYNRYIWAEYIWSHIASLPPALRKLVGAALAAPSPKFWDFLYSTGATVLRKDAASARLVGLKMQKLAGFIQQDSIQQGYEYLMSYWHNPARLLTESVQPSLTAENQCLHESAGYINQAMFSDQVKYLPGDNLAKVDRASMAVSLETRLPFLCHDVVDLSWRIPVRMKIRKGQTKWVLRQVLNRYIPPELIDRPKMGFSVPIADWLRGELCEWTEDLIADTAIISKGLMQKGPIMDVWHEHKKGIQDHSHRLWTILMFLAWMGR